MPRRNRPSKKQRNRQGGGVRPPMFDSNVELKHRFRFNATNDFNRNITRAMLLNLMLVNVNGAMNNARITAGIKLNRIEMWGLSSGASDITQTISSVEWLSQYSPSTEISDIGTPLHPPHLVTSPPRQSVASFWSLTGNNESEVIFNIKGGVGTVIDVWVTIVLMDDETPVTVTTNTNGVSTQMYFGYLDGQGPTALLIPVSLKSLS